MSKINDKHSTSYTQGPTIQINMLCSSCWNKKKLIQLQETFYLKLTVLLSWWTVWPTIVYGPHHSCSRTWCQCSSCRCHRRISGCRALSPPSRSASRCPDPPTTYRGCHLGSKQRQAHTHKGVSYFKEKKQKAQSASSLNATLSN